MFNGSNCDRKSQLSEIMTESLNPRDRIEWMNYIHKFDVIFLSVCHAIIRQ